MQAFIALLRAVNVGGTGKLPMTELKVMCEAAGFKSVRRDMLYRTMLLNWVAHGFRHRVR